MKPWNPGKPILLMLILIQTAFSFAHAGDVESRQQAVETAQQANGGNGKVLSVDTETDQNGNTVFAVKILTNGRVRVFRYTKAP